MTDDLRLLIYLDQNFIKDLHAATLDGVIESEIVRYSTDCATNQRIHVEKDQKSEVGIGLENRNENRRDVEHKKTYFSADLNYSSSHLFFAPVWEKMKQSGSTKDLCSIFVRGEALPGKCEEGEYVLFTGRITTVSIPGYIKAVRNMIEIYTPMVFDQMLQSYAMEGALPFSSIDKILEKLYLDLCHCGTGDMIVLSENCNIVLNLCTCEFESRNFHIYDNDQCKCKIWGKVCRKIQQGEAVKLLRKTGQEEYYKRLLTLIEAHLDCLRYHGIILPQKPKLEIPGPTMQVRPISIHI